MSSWVLPLMSPSVLTVLSRQSRLLHLGSSKPFCPLSTAQFWNNSTFLGVLQPYLTSKYQKLYLFSIAATNTIDITVWFCVRGLQGSQWAELKCEESCVPFWSLKGEIQVLLPFPAFRSFSPVFAHSPRHVRTSNRVSSPSCTAISLQCSWDRFFTFNDSCD